MSSSPEPNDGFRRSTRLPPLATPRAIATPNNRRGISVDAAPTSASHSVRREFRTHTPHAQAARRQIDERRRTLFNTPGRNARRRSLRDQRETPRDFLRNLSRALAPNTERITYSSSSVEGDSSPEQEKRRRSRTTSLGELEEDDEDAEDDDDEDEPIERPRLSLNLLDEEDDYSVLKPPRISDLHERDENTAHSIEFPRRVSQARDRLSMDSRKFGSPYRGLDIIPSDAEDTMNAGMFEPPPIFDDEETGELGAIDEVAITDERGDEVAAGARGRVVGRESDFSPIVVPETADETTFMMNGPQSSPVRGADVTGLMEGDDEPEDYDMPPGIGDDGYSSDGNEPMAPIEDYSDDNDGLPDQSEQPEEDATADIAADPSDLDLPEFTEDQEPFISFASPEHVMEERRSRLANLPRIKPGKKTKKISRHGIEYPSLPQGVIKRLATTFAKNAGISKAKITGDTLAAITQASDWFFEQLGDDLAAYAKHAGRKTIDENDMLTLMRRQRQTRASMTPFALAQKNLPRELLQEIRMPVPVPAKGTRKRRSAADDEEGT